MTDYEPELVLKNTTNNKNSLLYKYRLTMFFLGYILQLCYNLF